MRSSLQVTALAALTLITTTTFAQLPHTAAHPPAPHESLRQVDPSNLTSGRIQRWLVNPGGEVDGLLLADGTQVAVPPHLSASLLQGFKPGDWVQVEGWRVSNLPGARVVRAQALTQRDSGLRIVDTPPSPETPPPAPRDPAALTGMSVSGKVARMLYSGHGSVNGVLLDNGSIVRFPPHVGVELIALLQPGQRLMARGWGTQGTLGNALEATALGRSADAMQELFAAPGMAPVHGLRGPNGLPQPTTHVVQPPAPAVPPSPAS